MAGIRTIPVVRQEVEEYIAQLKAIAPTLSSDPTATGFHQSTFQPAGTARKGKQLTTPRATNHTNPNSGKNRAPQNLKQDFVYVAELGRVIPMVGSLHDVPATAKISSPLIDTQNISSDSECSSDEDCPFHPEPGMRLAWKRHSDGRKFFKVVEADDASPEMIVSYKLDIKTGNYERVLVPRHGKQLISEGATRSTSSTGLPRLAPS